MIIRMKDQVSVEWLEFEINLPNGGKQLCRVPKTEPEIDWAAVMVKEELSDAFVDSTPLTINEWRSLPQLWRHSHTDGDYGYYGKVRCVFKPRCPHGVYIPEGGRKPKMDYQKGQIVGWISKYCDVCMGEFVESRADLDAKYDLVSFNARCDVYKRPVDPLERNFQLHCLPKFTKVPSETFTHPIFRRDRTNADDLRLTTDYETGERKLETMGGYIAVGGGYKKLPRGRGHEEGEFDDARKMWFDSLDEKTQTFDPEPRDCREGWVATLPGVPEAISGMTKRSTSCNLAAKMESEGLRGARALLKVKGCVRMSSFWNLRLIGPKNWQPTSFPVVSHYAAPSNSYENWKELFADERSAWVISASSALREPVVKPDLNKLPKGLTVTPLGDGKLNVSYEKNLCWWRIEEAHVNSIVRGFGYHTEGDPGECAPQDQTRKQCSLTFEELTRKEIPTRVVGKFPPRNPRLGAYRWMFEELAEFEWNGEQRGIVIRNCVRPANEEEISRWLAKRGLDAVPVVPAKHRDRLRRMKRWGDGWRREETIRLLGGKGNWAEYLAGKRSQSLVGASFLPKGTTLQDRQAKIKTTLQDRQAAMWATAQAKKTKRIKESHRSAAYDGSLPYGLDLPDWKNGKDFLRRGKDVCVTAAKNLYRMRVLFSKRHGITGDYGGFRRWMVEEKKPLTPDEQLLLKWFVMLLLLRIEARRAARWCDADTIEPKHLPDNGGSQKVKVR